MNKKVNKIFCFNFSKDIVPAVGGEYLVPYLLAREGPYLKCPSCAYVGVPGLPGLPGT